MTTYKIGTVSIANGSNALSGTGGMQWTSIARPGDLIAIGAAIGVIATVNTNTSITLSRPWSGGTVSGAAYDLILIDAGNRDTTSLHELLTMLGAGNLKAFGELEGTEDMLPYFTGAGVLGLSGLTSQARTLLASTLLSRSGDNLVTGANARFTGGAVTESPYDDTPGRALLNGAWGLGILFTQPEPDFNLMPSGFSFSPITGLLNAPDINDRYWVYTQSSPGLFIQIARRRQGGSSPLYHRASTGDPAAATWRKVWDDSVTTVDSNGFIKEASPIVRLFNDQTEEPVEAVGASMTRHGVGEYTLSGVPPLATVGWQIEVPQDHNGNRLVFVDVSYDATSETLTINTSAPQWSAEQGRWVAGNPLDIPEGRWVDLRFHKDPEPEPAE